MTGLAAWRGVFIQTVMICCLSFLAWKAPEIRMMVVPILAGMAVHMAAKSRSDSSSGIAYYPGDSLGPSGPPSGGLNESRRKDTPYAGTPIPRIDKKVAVAMFNVMRRGIFAGTIALLTALILWACSNNQAPQITGPEIEAGIVIAQDVCQEVADNTGNPIVTLLCPFLDKQGGDAGKTITVQMPRVQWEAIKARSKDSGK